MFTKFPLISVHFVLHRVGFLKLTVRSRRGGFASLAIFSTVFLFSGS